VPARLAASLGYELQGFGFLAVPAREQPGQVRQRTAIVLITRKARKILATRGACRAATWKYETLPIGPTEGQGPPPGAEQEAKQNQWKRARALSRAQTVDIDGLRKRRSLRNSLRSLAAWPSAWGVVVQREMEFRGSGYEL